MQGQDDRRLHREHRERERDPAESGQRGVRRGEGRAAQPHRDARGGLRAAGAGQRGDRRAHPHRAGAPVLRRRGGHRGGRARPCRSAAWARPTTSPASASSSRHRSRPTSAARTSSCTVAASARRTADAAKNTERAGEPARTSRRRSRNRSVRRTCGNRPARDRRACSSSSARSSVGDALRRRSTSTTGAGCVGSARPRSRARPAARDVRPRPRRSARRRRGRGRPAARRAGSTARTLAREYNAVTPENAMKWDTIHPARDRYDFGPADAIVRLRPPSTTWPCAATTSSGTARSRRG